MTEQALSAFDLTHSAFEVLFAQRAQPHPRQLTPSELCKSALLTTGGTAIILIGLERKGLVIRLPNPEDGRGKIVQMTEKGEALIERDGNRHAKGQGTFCRFTGHRRNREVSRDLSFADEFFGSISSALADSDRASKL